MSVLAAWLERRLRWHGYCDLGTQADIAACHNFPASFPCHKPRAVTWRFLSKQCPSTPKFRDIHFCFRLARLNRRESNSSDSGAHRQFPTTRLPHADQPPFLEIWAQEVSDASGHPSPWEDSDSKLRIARCSPTAWLHSRMRLPGTRSGQTGPDRQKFICSPCAAGGVREQRSKVLSTQFTGKLAAWAARVWAAPCARRPDQTEPAQIGLVKANPLDSGVMAALVPHPSQCRRPGSMPVRIKIGLA